MAFIINVFAGYLVTVMKQQTELYAQTTTYIRLESLANIAVVLFHLVIIVHTALENYKSIFVITTIKMFLTIILDILFVSQYPISLNFGVNGIAYNNIISNLISVIIALIPTYKYFMNYIMNAQNLESVMSLIMILFPFYIFYAYYNIISNLLYAIGQIKYMLLQSFIVNTFFNIPYFILYLKGAYEITLLNITLRFGLAILISTVII
ncbi:MATE family efflux transporter [Brachyspira intermedia]|uniref:hypothetical protein n=1 Tax=Brachyspira intermedia TaxID=84377 RepID=UPI0002F73299|nr:hypothetical protein [Brachyspira intermedia]